MKNKVINLVILSVYYLIIFTTLTMITNAYHISPPVHQYLANESQNVWPLMPLEIKQHLATPISQNFDLLGIFNSGNDIITGSGEEDLLGRWIFHLWQPDSPGNNGNYSIGVAGFASSYVRARGFFITKVIPLYLKGEINESYYWLGRIAHLLEDASVPAHVHLDCHSPIAPVSLVCNGDDTLEEYTGNSNVFNSFKGINYKNQQYNYERFPNLNNFNWDTVDANNNTS